MRILFTAISAHGHLLPQVPAMRAALDAGNAVAVMVSEGLCDVVRDELPTGVDFLPAGPMPLELASLAAERTGGDLMHPTVEGIGETFGGVQLDLTIDAAVPLARDWRPDAIVSDMFSPLGAYLAAVLDVPWHEFVMTVALPETWRGAIDAAANRRFERAQLLRRPAASILDAWPASLGDGAHPPLPRRIPLRTTPHERAQRSSALSSGSREVVLLTMGTIFADAAGLESVARDIAATGRRVIATLPLSLGEDVVAGGGLASTEHVTWLPFVPLADVLDEVTIVVSAGGAGTVLAALSQGTPLVLFPQGADQPEIAKRVAAAGAGLVVVDIAAVTAAVAEVAADPSYRQRAKAIADEIAATPSPADAIAELVGESLRGYGIDPAVQ